MRNLTAKCLLSSIAEAKVTYFFYHVKKKNTQCMIHQFNEIASDCCSAIKEVDLRGSASLLCRHVTRSLNDTVSIALSTATKMHTSELKKHNTQLVGLAVISKSSEPHLNHSKIDSFILDPSSVPRFLHNMCYLVYI